MFRMLMRIAQSWNFSPQEIAESRVSTEKRDELVAGMRAHYGEEAEHYIDPAWGTKIFLLFFARELEPATNNRRRCSKAKQNAQIASTKNKTERKRSNQYGRTASAE
jgi:hypothetical protein